MGWSRRNRLDEGGAALGRGAIHGPLPQGQIREASAMDGGSRQVEVTGNGIVMAFTVNKDCPRKNSY